MILEHWEHDIRKEIGCFFEMHKDEVKSDIMGDLNKIRHDLLHNRGKPENSMKNKIIRFSEREQITISSSVFDTVFEEVFKYLNGLFIEITGKAAYLDNSLNLKAKENHRSTTHKLVFEK